MLCQPEVQMLRSWCVCVWCKSAWQAVSWHTCYFRLCRLKSPSCDWGGATVCFADVLCRWQHRLWLTVHNKAALRRPRCRACVSVCVFGPSAELVACMCVRPTILYMLVGHTVVDLMGIDRTATQTYVSRGQINSTVSKGQSSAPGAGFSVKFDRM